MAVFGLRAWCAQKGKQSMTDTWSMTRQDFEVLPEYERKALLLSLLQMERQGIKEIAVRAHGDEEKILFYAVFAAYGENGDWLYLSPDEWYERLGIKFI